MACNKTILFNQIKAFASTILTTECILSTKTMKGNTQVSERGVITKIKEMLGIKGEQSGWGSHFRFLNKNLKCELDLKR